MSKKKSFIAALLLVVVAGLSITAGTFAYFQWTTGAEGGTSVNVTIEMGGITMHIEPEATEFVGLYPTAHCINNVRYGDALVTIVNNTGTLAIPSFKLKVRVTDKDGNGVPADALSHINYSVVPIETTKDAQGNPVKGTAGSYSCSSLPRDIDLSGWNIGQTFTNADTWNTHLKFESVATDGNWTHIPNTGDKSYIIWEEEAPSEIKNASTSLKSSPAYLPRQYYYYVGTPAGGASYESGETNGITFRGEAYTTSYQYYRVYVWVDEGYTTTIVGNTISDPLQNAKIEITWSEDSIIQQVSGESNVEEELAPGLYDNNSNMVSTWQQLLDNGDITVVDNVITASNWNLTGILVIPEGIVAIGENAFGDFIDHRGTHIQSVNIPASLIEIGEGAFASSAIKTITFASNGRLEVIGRRAFDRAQLTSIEIPVSVESISSDAFSGCPLTNLTFAENGRLTVIEYGAFIGTNIVNLVIPEGITKIFGEAFMSSNYLTSVEIPASITLISYNAFGLSSNLSQIIFDGTMAQWNAIDLYEGWNQGVPATKVICSDGEITL